MTFASQSEADAAYDVVYAALGCRRMESLTSAAFRVRRENIAAPHVLEVARIVAGMTGAPPLKQWSVLKQAAAVIHEHAPVPTGVTT
jgi:hypothetical protein